MGEAKRLDDYLKTLPPDVAAKMREQKQNESTKALTDMLTNHADETCNALMDVAVIACAEATDTDEREHIFRATTLVLTTLRQLAGVIVHVLPPQPRKVVIEALMTAIQRELVGHDKLLRKLLPQGVAQRSMGKNPIPDDALFWCPSCHKDTGEPTTRNINGEPQCSECGQLVIDLAKARQAVDQTDAPKSESEEKNG